MAHTDWFIDAHLDMAYNALNWKRDLRRSAFFTREQERGTLAQKHNGQAMVGLPELVRGRVGLVFGTIFCQPHTHQMNDHELAYHDEQEAHAQGMAQLDFYRRWEEREPEHIKLVTTQKDLALVSSAWSLAKSQPATLHRRVGIVPLMEGADPIREPKELEMWYAKGLRIVGLAWDTTRYAGGTWMGGGLTKLGRELLDMMAEFNVILDVSHLAQRALMEALDLFEGKHVIASHSNPRRILDTERHLPDKAIERIAQRGGVIGVVLFNKFLQRDWSGKKHDVTLDHVIRAIDHICQVTGSADHVGIGSDFDGGFGSEATPRELDSARDFYKIQEELLQRGYNPKHIEKMMRGNWLRVLQAALP